MAIYEYLKVALTEQSERELSTVFTYNGDTAPADWTTTFPVPGVVFDHFLNARDCYVQWTTADGNYISLIFRNPFASRNGFYMLTLFVGKGCGLTGRQVVRIMSGLRKKLVEEKQTTVQAVEDILRNASVPVEPVSFDAWRISATSRFRDDQPECYRTFVSVQEIENYFTFLHQEEYDKYSRVIYVAATTSLRPGVDIPHVIQPLRNLYTIETPAGVDVSRKAASAGDRVMLTFTREGFTPVHEAVVVGRPSMFATYDGAVMRVKSADECRVVFTRRIPIEVKSAKGGPIVGYTVAVNGRPVSTVEPFIEITEQDLASKSPINILVSSTNFETLSIEKQPSELTPGDTIEFVLRPIEQGVTLRLDFGEGRIIEMTLMLEKNTPEYKQLHSGQFHGFRAHRLTVPGRGEIYNVDVRAAGRPVSPRIERVTDTPATGGARTEEKSEPSTPVPPKITRHEDAAGAVEERSRNERRRNNMIGLIGGSIMLVLLIAAAVVYFVPSWRTGLIFNSEGEAIGVMPMDTVVTDSAETAVILSAADSMMTETAREAVPVVPVTAADAADCDYLNRSTVWVRDSLQSDNGRALYDALAAGDIAAAATNNYFSTPGRCTNTSAVKMIDLIWSSHTTPTEKSNQRCMTRMAEKGSIDVRQLYEDVARFRAAEPNPTPRPGSEQ